MGPCGRFSRIRKMESRIQSGSTPSLRPVAPDAAGSAPWSVEVAVGAVRECGPLLSARWQTCGAVLAEATAELFLQLPEPTAVRISGVHVGGSAAQRGWASGSSLTLAPEGDLATLGGIEVPSSASFDVMVDFRDPLTNATSSRDFTLDPRVSLAVSDAACAALVESTMRTVAVPSDTSACGGASFGVTATLTLGATVLTSEEYTVALATFSALSLRLDASPAGPTGVTTLRKVQCTGTYQRARPHVVAALSTGAERTVTAQCSFASDAPSVVSVSGSGNGAIFAGQAAGTAQIIATFGATATASMPLTSDSGAHATVASLSLYSVPHVLHLPRNGTRSSALRAVLDDGTVYSSLHELGWLEASAVVQYSSDAPAAVAIDRAGTLTLLDNHESRVSLSAETACLPTVLATATTAANLAVPYRAVDLGANDGLQFEPSGGAVPVPVVVNTWSSAGTAYKLVSFQVLLRFDPSLLLADDFDEGVGGNAGAQTAFSGVTVTLNDPVDVALLVGDKDGASAPSGRVQLGTLSLAVQGGASGVTRISGDLVGLITCAVCDGSDDEDELGLGPITDGAGYVVLSSARRRRGLQLGVSSHTLQPLPQQPSPRRLAAAAHGRKLSQEEGSCCGGVVGSDAFYGDVNGDCVFDIKDVRRASVLQPYVSQPATLRIPACNPMYPRCAAPPCCCSASLAARRSSPRATAPRRCARGSRRSSIRPSTASSRRMTRSTSYSLSPRSSASSMRTPSH